MRQMAGTMLRWTGLFGLMLVALVLCPILVAVLLPWANPEGVVFAGWLGAFNTWDDQGPSQGMYEPAVAWVYRNLGWYAKTWYWLGWRNQIYGLFHLLPGPTDWTQVSFSQSPPTNRIYSAKMSIGMRGYFEWHLPYVLRIGWKLKDIINSKRTPNDRPMFCFQPFKKPT